MIKGTLEPGEFERMITEIESLPKLPAAIEAFWDGDSIGWMVYVSAIIDESSPGLPRYTDHFLATLQGVGGDFRVFKNQVPPWPEAELAKEFGGALAAHFRIPFFFPSPDHPENECPRWWEREQGIPCGRCGVLLHQDDSCSWRGVCYHCHGEEEKSKKEATWSPEERAGFRCEICGNPAKGILVTAHLCLNCLDEYEEIYCSRCDVRGLYLKTISHTDICSSCNLLAKFDSLMDEQKEAIRRMAKSGKMIETMKEVRRFLGVDLGDAQFIAKKLAE